MIEDITSNAECRPTDAQIRALAAAIDRYLIWQCRMAELRERHRYERRVRRQTNEPPSLPIDQEAVA